MSRRRSKLSRYELISDTIRHGIRLETQTPQGVVNLVGMVGVVVLLAVSPFAQLVHNLVVVHALKDPELLMEPLPTHHAVLWLVFGLTVCIGLLLVYEVVERRFK